MTTAASQSPSSTTTVRKAPFGEEALQRKRKVTSEASAVQGQELSLQDLLARIGSGAASSGMDSKDAATGQGSENEKASKAPRQGSLCSRATEDFGEVQAKGGG